MTPPHKRILAVGALLALLGSGSVLADHNSVWGEGWARMPNDIHNTRIDTLGDNTTFRDFVRGGAGSTSVNRYLDSDSVRGSRAMSRDRSASAAGAAGATRQGRGGRGGR
jgi:hypothetical protein